MRGSGWIIDMGRKPFGYGWQAIFYCAKCGCKSYSPYGVCPKCKKLMKGVLVKVK